jgi:tetratricopeptide (TPR) repeat protein
MERSRFPTVLELITGKFLRHSRAFYEWRIEDRLRKLEADPTNLALIDDLAVAYDKTGQHDKAIATIWPSYRINPNRYETVANLGTFHVHAGRLEDGRSFIGRAIAINPDAHFGRERFQKYLVEYVLIRRGTDGRLALPLSRKALPGGRDEEEDRDFYRFVNRKITGGEPIGRPWLAAQEHHAAIRGVLGMMRFGKHDSPVLLEALGDLLAAGRGGPIKESTRLAARAYLKASYEVKDEAARTAYRKLAHNATEYHSPGGPDGTALDRLEQDFKAELADARTWYADLEQKERRWVRESRDPEAEFDRLYADEPGVVSPDNALPPPDADSSPPEGHNPHALGVGIGAAILVGLGLGCWWLWRPARARRGPALPG